MAVGIIIIVINAALLIFYLYLILQFIILPRLRPWVPRLVRASKLDGWRRAGTPAASCLSRLGCPRRPELVFEGDATVVQRSTPPTGSRRRSMVKFLKVTSLRGCWHARGVVGRHIPDGGDVADAGNASITHTSPREASCSTADYADTVVVTVAATLDGADTNVVTDVHTTQ